MLPLFSLFSVLVAYTKQSKSPPVCVPDDRRPPLLPPPAPRRAHPSDLPLLVLNLEIGSPPCPEASRPRAIPNPHPSSPEFGPPLAGATAPVGRPPPPFPTPPQVPLQVALDSLTLPLPLPLAADPGDCWISAGAELSPPAMAAGTRVQGFKFF
jgi:hypothetical protein